MISFGVLPSASGPIPNDVGTLIRESGVANGLSDHLRLDLDQALETQPPERFIAIAATITNDSNRHLVGYGQVSAGNDADLVEIVVDTERPIPDHLRPGRLRVDLLDTAIDAHQVFGSGAPLRWWTDTKSAADETTRETDDVADEVIAAAVERGFRLERTLWRMEVDLDQLWRIHPRGQGAVTTRSFDPQTDAAALLELNNRAFAGHGEQGGWTGPLLQRRLDESWFRPDGLRILDHDGRMIGFCWTKPHNADLGEIYIIGIDPDAAGRGLGTALVLDGLATISDTGATRAMLWVDADNDRAVRLYERLGFTVRQTRSAFRMSAST